MSDHPAITDADYSCAAAISKKLHPQPWDSTLVDELRFATRQAVAPIIAAHRAAAVQEALEAERQRDNRVYRALEELLHASTPADRANLAAGLLVALDKLAENQTDHVVDANKMAASEQAADHFADAGKMVEKTEAKP